MKMKIVMGLLLFFAVIIPGIASAQPWSGITEVTPENIGDDFNPQLAVYNGKLYAVKDKHPSKINPGP